MMRKMKLAKRILYIGMFVHVNRITSIKFASRCLQLPCMFYFRDKFNLTDARECGWRQPTARLVTRLKYMCARRSNGITRFYYFAGLRQEVITACRFVVHRRPEGNLQG